VKISLDHNEIIEALTRFVKFNRVNNGVVKEIKLTAGRKNNGYSAIIDITFDNEKSNNSITNKFIKQIDNTPLPDISINTELTGGLFGGS
jgi:hypothetical protein